MRCHKRTYLLTCKAGFRPDQPGVPSGNSNGGQWTLAGGATHQSAKNLSTSKRGIRFIAEHEAFRSSVYNDQAGYPTIGYGHKLQPGESYPKGITKEDAIKLLAEDIGIAERAVQTYVKAKITQDQFDALTSLTYNIGVGNFVRSTLLRLLNQGEYASAAEQFPVWNKITVNGILKPSRGLIRRRDSERALFLGKKVP